MSERRLAFALVVSLGIATLLGSSGANAEGPKVGNRKGLGGGSPDISTFIVDPSTGGNYYVETELFHRLTLDPKSSIEFFVTNLDRLDLIKQRRGEIRGYASPGRVEMLRRPVGTYAEDSPANEVPVKVEISGASVIVGALSENGFPGGSQIAITLPAPEGGGYVARTFTEGRDSFVTNFPVSGRRSLIAG